RHPAKGRPFVSIGFPGLPGVLTGINESGLFVGDRGQIRKNTSEMASNAVPAMSRQRVLLETCKTAEEAVARIETMPRTVPQNYVIADAERAYFLEADAARVVRREPCNDTVTGTNWAEEKRGVFKGDARFGLLCG